MYARVFTFSLGPGSRDAAAATADEAFKLAKTLKGFVSATYLIYDDTDGEYGSITLWERKADAVAAGEALNKAFAGKFVNPPHLRTGEVYEPH